MVKFDYSRVYPSDHEYYVLLYEFREGVEKYLGNSVSKMKTLEDVIAFNNANSDRVMPHFNQDILYLSSKSKNIFRYLFSKWKLRSSYRDTLKILEKYELEKSVNWKIAIIKKINKFSAIIETRNQLELSLIHI